MGPGQRLRYTHYVDVCPNDLAIHQRALARLGPIGERNTSILITVDSAHDTSAVIAYFLASFRPGTVRLPGPEALALRDAAVPTSSTLGHSHFS